MTTSDLMIWATLMLSYSVWVIWLERDDAKKAEFGFTLLSPVALRLFGRRLAVPILIVHNGMDADFELACAERECYLAALAEARGHSARAVRLSRGRRETSYSRVHVRIATHS
jgi:hypothetical protein